MYISSSNMCKEFSLISKDSTYFNPEESNNPNLFTNPTLNSNNSFSPKNFISRDRELDLRPQTPV